MSQMQESSAFPTGVGMNRLGPCVPTFLWSVPHGRGDEPWENGFSAGISKRSPRAWG